MIANIIVKSHRNAFADSADGLECDPSGFVKGQYRYDCIVEILYEIIIFLPESAYFMPSA